MYDSVSEIIAGNGALHHSSSKHTCSPLKGLRTPPPPRTLTLVCHSPATRCPALHLDQPHIQYSGVPFWRCMKACTINVMIESHENTTDVPIQPLIYNASISDVLFKHDIMAKWPNKSALLWCVQVMSERSDL